MISTVSIKDRLKNQARKSGKTLQDELVTYGLERTIYRISISKYASSFTLKGGIFLYSLFEGNYARFTSDIDLLGNSVNNDIEEMLKVFLNIFSIECDDGLVFDLNSIKVISITEFKKYHGVNVSILSYLGKTKIPISIDIGFGDIVYPKRVLKTFPTLLNMDQTEVYSYTIYSVLAEKFEAIVSLGLVNSRYKDFYDIYMIAMRIELDGNVLKDALIKTFHHRNTGFTDIVVFDSEYLELNYHQVRWLSFVKKKKAMAFIEFEEAIEVIKLLFLPIIEAIQGNQEFTLKWNSEKRCWK